MGDAVPLDDIAVVVVRWQRARSRAARQHAIAEQAEREIAARLSDAEIGTVDGEPAVRRATEERPRFDFDRFRAEYPQLYAEFTSQHQHTRLVPLRQRASASSEERGRRAEPHIPHDEDEAL